MTNEPCSTFLRGNYKGQFAPKCNCYPCWEAYFRANATKMYTTVLASQKFGWDSIAKVQGKKYVQALKRFLKEEEAKGTRII